MSNIQDTSKTTTNTMIIGDISGVRSSRRVAHFINAHLMKMSVEWGDVFWEFTQSAMRHVPNISTNDVVALMGELQQKDPNAELNFEQFVVGLQEAGILSERETIMAIVDSQFVKDIVEGYLGSISLFKYKFDFKEEEVDKEYLASKMNAIFGSIPTNDTANPDENGYVGLIESYRVIPGVVLDGDFMELMITDFNNSHLPAIVESIRNSVCPNVGITLITSEDFNFFIQSIQPRIDTAISNAIEEI